MTTTSSFISRVAAFVLPAASLPGTSFVFIAVSCIARDGVQRHIVEGMRQGAIPWLMRRVLFQGTLRTLDDTKVAFRSGTECLKSSLVCLACMSREGDLVAVE